MNLVDVHALNKSYLTGQEILPVLKDLDFQLEQGKIALITGESGCGKSTFLNILGGLDSCESGEVRIAGQEISLLEEEALSEFRRNRIGFIFQSHYLMKDFTALENVLLPRYLAGVPRKEAERQALVWLEAVEMGDRKHHYPAQLSGGERQRVAVARSLVNDPDLVLADEPTGNLDERNSRVVEDLLFRLVADHGKTLILVTHDPRLAVRGDFHYHLGSGGLSVL